MKNLVPYIAGLLPIGIIVSEHMTYMSEIRKTSDSITRVYSCFYDIPLEYQNEFLKSLSRSERSDFNILLDESYNSTIMLLKKQIHNEKTIYKKLVNFIHEKAS